MVRALVAGVLLVLVFGLVSAPGVGETTRSQATFEEPSDFDSTIFYVEVYENGSVLWTSQYHVVLENDSEVSEYETFVEEFESEETALYADFRRQAIADRVDPAAEETGRPMDADSFARSATVENDADESQNDTVGVIEMSFVWENATARQGQQLVLGDVFGGGLYLDEDQTFVVQAGDGVRFVSVSPMESAVISNSTLNQSESVTWTGEEQFADQRPRAVFVQDVGEPGLSSELTWGMIGLLIVLLGVGGVLLWRQVSLPTRPTIDRGGGTEGSSISEEELLSDETRVEQLLAEHGNRMKQVDIVEETGWSKAKVSTLLSEMAEQGTISKLRIGRENIITLEREEGVVERSTDDRSS